MGDQKIGVEFSANTAAAVQAVNELAASMREQTTAAENAGKGQKTLGREVAQTRAAQLDAGEAARKAAEATQVHTLTVQAFGKSSREAKESQAKLTAATQEAKQAQAAAAKSLETLAKSVTAAAAAEDGNLSPATKRAAAQVEKMGKDAQKTAGDLNKMELASKKGSGGFDLMGMASGKLMGILGPAALGGTIVALAGWLGEASAKTLQYETALLNLPFALEGARAATHGLMSDSALAVSASQALALGVVKTEAEFNQLASDAAKIALKLGTSTDQMLGDLTTALGRGSAMILDNAGIILKVSDANEAYAKSIGKAVSELDEAEKKIAFQTAAMEAIRKSADATAVAYDGNAAALARLKIGAGDAWDAMERGAVNGAGSVVKAIMSIDDELPRLQEAADAAAREMMRSGDWSQGFKDTATAVGLAAVELGGFSDVLAHFQNVINDPQRDEKIAANLDMEREKAALMQQEAHFAELQQKALEKINKDQESFLEAQAAASVVYGPALPPKAEAKKKGPKKKTALDLVKSTEFRHDESDLVGEMFAADLAAEQEGRDRIYEVKQLALERDLEILDARGLAESDAQAAREAIINRQLAAEEEFAQQQMRFAQTDAQREAATTRMEAVEHQRRLINTRKAAAAEQAEQARKVALVEKVTSRVGSLGEAMVQAAWDAAEGQKGAGLMALGEYLKTVSKQMAIKALVETALGVSALAGVVTAGLAPGHFAAAGIAAGVAVAAGGAGVGLSKAGEARAESGKGRPESASTGPAEAPAAPSSAGAQSGGSAQTMPREAPVSYYDPTRATAANAPAYNIDLRGATFIGAGSPEKVAQEIRKILTTGKAAGAR